MDLFAKNKFFLNLINKYNLKKHFSTFKTKIKSKKYIFYFFLFLYFSIIFILGVIDLKKEPEYDPPRENNYEEIDWEEKYDNEGYSHFESADGCFDWRAVITPPNKSYPFKVLDLSIINIQIKNLEGQVEFSSYVNIKDKINYSRTEKTKIITDKDATNFTLTTNTHFASFLGISFVSSHQGSLITINKRVLTSATIQLPRDSKVIMVGDGNNPANSYRVDDSSYFFHNISNPAIVYYQINYHLITQIILVTTAIILLIAVILIVRKYPLPSIKLSNEKFFISLILVLYSMFFLANLLPNPNSLVLNWDSRANIKYDYENGYVKRDNEISNYLWWVLAFTRSIDAMVIGDDIGIACGRSHYRFLYLSKFSVQKFIVVEGYEDNHCSKLMKTIAPNKTVVVPQDKVLDELNSLKNRSYFLKFLFPLNAKAITILSDLLVFLCTAFLTWRAFTVRKIKDFFLIFIYGVIIFIGLVIAYTICGTLAHMPIGYHGLSNAGLIMSNYAWPGIFRGGNNLRTLFALLGCFSVVLFCTKIKNKINLIIYPILFLITVSLFVIPQTEYFSKRVLLTTTSAEAYVWDYKINYFNPLDFYRSIRDNSTYEYLKKALDRNTEANAKIKFAYSLMSELRYDEAKIVLEEVVNNNKLSNVTRADAYIGLGDLFYKLSTINKDEDNNNLFESINYYKKALELAPESINNKKALKQLVQIYNSLGDHVNLADFTLRLLNKYPNDADIISTLEKILAENYSQQNDFEKSIKLYNNYIVKFPYLPNLSKIKLSLAKVYEKIKEIDKSNKLYIDVISNEPVNLNYLIEAYRSINRNYKNTNDYLTKSVDAFQFEIVSKSGEVKKCGTVIKEGTYNKGSYVKAFNIYSELEKQTSPGEIFTANNIFRKAEVLRKMLGNEELSDEKRIEYLNLSIEEYKKVIKKYPNTPFSAAALRKLGIGYGPTDIVTGIDLNYNLGKDDLAFDGYGLIYPRQQIYLPGSINARLSCYIPNCNSRYLQKCRTQCNNNTFQILIEAKGFKVNENDAWPKMQLYLNNHIVQEWLVDSNNFKKYFYSFKLPNSNFDFNIVYPGNNENDYSLNNGLSIKKITINDKEINLLDLPDVLSPSFIDYIDSSPAESKLENDKSEILLYYDKIINRLNKYFYPSNSYTTDLPTFRNLYLDSRGVSRGIALYCSGVLVLSILFLLQKYVRTIATPLIFLMLSRGIIRIAEHDLARAWYSIIPGVNTGVQLIVVLILVSVSFSIVFGFIALLALLLNKIFKIKNSRKNNSYVDSIQLVDKFLPLTETFISSQIKGLHDQNISTDIYCHKIVNEEVFSSDNIHSYKDLLKYKFLYYKIKGKIKNTDGAMLYWNDLIQKRKIGLIHSHFGWMANKGIDLAIKNNLPHIASFYGSDITRDPLDPKKLDYKNKLPLIFKNSDKIICTSNFLKNKLIALGAKENKITVLRPAISVKKYEIAKDNNVFRIISVGRLIECKGHQYLIRAIPYIIKEYKDIQITIVGQGPLLNDLKKLAKELKVSRYVKFVGDLPNNLVIKKMYTSDLMIHPSIKTKDGKEETLGIVLAEAALCGLPSIASSIGGIPEIIFNNRTGILVEEKYSLAIAHNTIKLIKNREFLKFLGKNAKLHSNNLFNYQKQINKLINIYSSIIKKYE